MFVAEHAPGHAATGGSLVSSLNDFLNAISADNADAISIAGAAIGLAAQIGSIASGVVAVVQFIENTINPANAQVLSAITKLDSDLQQAKSDIELQAAANFISTALQNFDVAIETAQTDFSRLTDYLSDPKLTDDFIQARINECFTANAFFADNDDLWQWAWLDAPKYSDMWSGTIAPPQTEFVFNYTPLPYLLRSIYILLAVVGALRPSEYTASPFQDRLNKSRTRLETVHSTIQSAIVSTRIPQPQDIEYISYERTFERLGTNWINAQGRGLPFVAGDPSLWPYGAVEIYSGANNVDTYWPFLPLKVYPADGATFTGSFMGLLRLRIADHQKKLYTGIGLPSVRQGINQLRAMTGQPPLPDQPFGVWSLKEIFTILGIPLLGSWLTSMVPFLKAAPPYSGGILFPLVNGQYPPSPLPKSFRSLFAAP